MYICNTCSKKYITEDRYISHKERCDNRNKELTPPQSQYKLKSNLDLDTNKKLLNEISVFKVSLNTQRDEISVLKETLNTQRDEIKVEYTNKLKKHKEIIDKKHKDEISRLQKTICKDSIEVNSKGEFEKIKIKEDLERSFNEKQVKLLFEMEKYQNELLSNKQALDKERNEIKRITKEKELYKIKCDDDKKNDIQIILAEKNTIITMLNNNKEGLERKLIEIQNKYDTEILNIKYEYDKTIKYNESKVNEYIKSLISKIDEDKLIYESKLENINNQIKVSVEMEIQRSTKIIGETKSQCEKILEAERHSQLLKINNLNVNIQTLKDEMQMQHRVSTELIQRKEKELNDMFKISFDNLNNEKDKIQSELDKHKFIIDSKDMEITSLSTKLVNKIDECNFKQKEMEKIRIQYLDNKESYLNTMNMSSETFKKTIQEKIHIITTIDNKLKIIDEEYKSKLSLYATEIDNHKSIIRELNKDIERNNKESQENTRKISQLEEIKDKLIFSFENQIEDRLIKEREIIRKNIDMEYVSKPPKHIETEIFLRDSKIKVLETSLANVKNDFTKTLNMITQEKDIFKTELDKLTKESKNDLLSLKSNCESILDIKNKEYESKLSSLNKDNITKCKEIDELNIKIYNIINENTVKTNKLEKVYNNTNKLLKDEVNITTQETIKLNNMYIKLSSEYTNIQRISEDRYKEINENLKDFKEKEKILNDEIYNNKKENSKMKLELEKVIIDTNTLLNSTKKQCEDQIRTIQASNKSLEGLIQINKDTYERDRNDLLIKMKNTLKEMKDKEEYYIQKIKDYEEIEDILVNKINGFKEEISGHLETIKNNKEQYISRLNGHGPPKYMARIEELEKELSNQEKILSTKDSAIIQMSIEIDNIREEMKSEKNRYDQREFEFNAQLKDYKTINPFKMEYEDKIKKMRDEWLQAISKQKSELLAYKDLTNQNKDKAVNLEILLNEKQKELSNILNTHDEMKKNFINTLNQQKTDRDTILSEKDKLLDKKDTRISELEGLLKETITKITST